MNIIGLDIGRCTCVAAACSEFPKVPLRHFAENRNNFVRIDANRKGAETLLAMKPDGIVMEPTGSWYSSFWKALADCHNIPIYWVGHADLSHQRASYGFQNKRDDEDAFCLALCYWDDRFIDSQERKRFLKFEAGAIADMRDRFHESEQLDKVRTGLVNQLRQRLSKEFPEISERQFSPSKKLGFSPCIGWLAGIHTYKRIESEYAKSIAHDLCLTISDYTREHAKRIASVEKQASAAEAELRLMLALPEFHQYMKVFHRFGFGFKNKTLMLFQCYPFSKFQVEGKPWIDWELPPARRDKLAKKDKPPKPQKRNRSLRSFQAYLGLSYKLKQSGDSLKKKFLGSDLVRSHLYMWAIDYMLKPDEGFNAADYMTKNKHGQFEHKLTAQELYQEITVFKLNTSIGWELNKKLLELAYDGVEGTDKIIRLLFRTTALLFRELNQTVK